MGTRNCWSLFDPAGTSNDRGHERRKGNSNSKSGYTGANNDHPKAGLTSNIGILVYHEECR